MDVKLHQKCCATDTEAQDIMVHELSSNFNIGCRITCVIGNFLLLAYQILSFCPCLEKAAPLITTIKGFLGILPSSFKFPLDIKIASRNIPKTQMPYLKESLEVKTQRASRPLPSFHLPINLPFTCRWMLYKQGNRTQFFRT